MRFVFMGTPEFAVPSMRALAQNHQLVGVVTAPDKPAGRGKKLQMSAVKVAAMELGVPVLQPTNLKDPGFQDTLRNLDAALFVVVAFRMLPEAVWAMPPKGTINLHASLLPAYRGAAPINWAIINGETETGLSTFFIERDIDTGAIIEQARLSIGPNENAGNLHDRMMDAGADLLTSTVDKIAAGEAKGMPQQPEAGGKPLPAAPKIFRDDCRVQWDEPAAKIHNHIRGLSPYPAAFTVYTDAEGKEQAIKLFASEPAQGTPTGRPGTFEVDGPRLTVNAGDGRLHILELQAPGKRRMSTSDFLRGFQFSNFQFH